MLPILPKVTYFSEYYPRPIAFSNDSVSKESPRTYIKDVVSSVLERKIKSLSPNCPLPEVFATVVGWGRRGILGCADLAVQKGDNLEMAKLNLTAAIPVLSFISSCI